MAQLLQSQTPEFSSSGITARIELQAIIAPTCLQTQFGLIISSFPCILDRSPVLKTAALRNSSVTK